MTLLPSNFELIRFAWGFTFKNYRKLFVYAIIPVFLALLLYYLGSGIIGLNLLLLIPISIIEYGIYKTILSLIDNQLIGFSNTYSHRSQLLKFFAAYILYVIFINSLLGAAAGITAISVFALLISDTGPSKEFIFGIPILITFCLIMGLYLTARFQFYGLLIIDKNAGVFSSFKLSWQMTKGHVFKMYGLMILLALQNALSILTLGITNLLIYPVNQTTITNLYRKLSPLIQQSNIISQGFNN